MTNEIIQFARGDQKQPIGVFVAVKKDEVIHTGWSKCHLRLDSFNKVRGLEIARGRALTGSRIALPRSRNYRFRTTTVLAVDGNKFVETPVTVKLGTLQDQWDIFNKRANTYFKPIPIEDITVGEGVAL